MSEQFFNLQTGEKVIQEIKPTPSLRTFYFFKWFPICLFLSIWLLAFFGFLKSAITKTFSFDFSTAIFAVLIILVLPFFLASNEYSHRYYWITNKRIIFKRGILGYSITSTPLERISDIAITRTLFEKIFKIQGLQIESLAGQHTPQGIFGGGAESSLQAIPEPEKTQELIFSLVKKKRKTEKLSF